MSFLTVHHPTCNIQPLIQPTKHNSSFRLFRQTNLTATEDATANLEYANRSRNLDFDAFRLEMRAELRMRCNHGTKSQLPFSSLQVNANASAGLRFWSDWKNIFQPPPFLDRG
ncbi:hypothetical protein [Absidia glauca]|uniref:Uncharacterized protein n=1 Tax=Absidia glauca TaxID=4829 RepID=A0A163JY60_ABSGL|nr:hypothetical protein [Absidia glauca]